MIVVCEKGHPRATVCESNPRTLNMRKTNESQEKSWQEMETVGKYPGLSKLPLLYARAKSIVVTAVCLERGAVN